MSRFTLPIKQPNRQPTSLLALRRALILEMFGSLKWFGSLESGDALQMAERIRRQKKIVQFPVVEAKPLAGPPGERKAA